MFVALLALWASFAVVGPAGGQAARQVLVLNLSGPLTPAMAEYLDRGLSQAARLGAEAVVLELDTPGGQVDLMNRMVQAIRASETPVIVYVAPRGAIAGSAGTVLVLAGHAAAMAPETAIGAASPVGAQGEDLGETIETKTKEILKATVRSLASRRGEQAVALAEATVEEGKAASAAEALEAGLIDLLAGSRAELLEGLDGFEIELLDGRRTLMTASATTTEVSPTFIEEFLGTLTNPNIVFLLITVGVQAVLIELSAPGGWVAGFIGVVCLALGIYGLGILPVNWFGLVLILTAFVLFALEIKAPTHGALAAAGLASFIMGALVLFNSPGTPAFQRVSIPLVVATGLVTAGLFLLVVSSAIRAQRRRAEVGSEALVGRVAQARTNLDPTGTVHIAGELWSARLAEGEGTIPKGASVTVERVEGLQLLVREAEGSTSR
jgi:membrane-bound serine protease (ClpP class)